MRTRVNGFTLIEVLVALVIVVLGMAALLGSMTSAADTTIYLRDKTFAEWIALNRVTELRLQAQLPAKGVSSGDVEDFAGRRWHWEQDVQPLKAKGMWRIDVRVRPAEIPSANKGSWYAAKTGIVGDAIDYVGLQSSPYDLNNALVEGPPAGQQGGGKE